MMINIIEAMPQGMNAIMLPIEPARATPHFLFFKANTPPTMARIPAIIIPLMIILYIVIIMVNIILAMYSSVPGVLGINPGIFIINKKKTIQII